MSAKSDNQDLRQYLLGGLRHREKLNLPPGWRDIGGVILPPQMTLEEWKAKQDTLFPEKDQQESSVAPAPTKRDIFEELEDI